MTVIAVKLTLKEYDEKCEAGYLFVDGDQKFEALAIVKLISVGFVGAFLATACGLSPGAIFFPVMIQLNMHSAVASSTGMYLTMYTTIAATINMLVVDRINVTYMLILCVLAIAGSIPGIFFQRMIREKASGRTIFTVGILISVLIAIALTLTPYMAYEAA